jgi:hypothetical protein
MRKAGKKDLNQAAIVAALRAIGCEVLICNLEGWPDLLCHRAGVWLAASRSWQGVADAADPHLCERGMRAELSIQAARREKLDTVLLLQVLGEGACGGGHLHRHDGGGGRAQGEV